MIYDVAFYSYLSIFLMAIFNLSIYLFRSKKRWKSHWYIYVMILFASFIITYGFGIYARYLRFYNPDYYSQFMGTAIWSMKNWLLVIVMAAITGNTIYRFWFKPRIQTQFELKTEFTADQCNWLVDNITSLMLWFSYEERASSKLKNKMQVMLDKIRDQSEACTIEEDKKG